ncbi:MAG: hypothetical protein M0R77_02225 [Gammaproteobacteria bacterium]|nr:hypothetical protein [Gammaproteobacteria bacterium]
MTSNVGFTSIEVAITEPQRPKVGFVGAEVLLKPVPGTTVGFAAVQVITKLNPPTDRRVHSEIAEVIISPTTSTSRISNVNTEVVLKAPTPIAYVTNQNIDVAVTGDPIANVSWMGTELLMSIAPAVQSNFSWMGLEFLVPSDPKISLNWLGMEMLVDVKLLDDLPDYLDFGDAYDGVPNQDLYSYPVTISGLSESTIITLYSYDGLQFSSDGNSFSSTINVQNDDQVYLKKYLDNIFSDTYLIYTDSTFTGETEVGTWQLVGPSDAIKYDEYIYRNTQEGQWIEYKAVADGDNDIESVFVDQSKVGNTGSPVGLFTNETIYNSDAPNGDFADQSSSLKNSKAPDSDFRDQTAQIKYAFAPIGIFKDQTNELKYGTAPTSLFISKLTYYETVESLKALFFNNIHNSLVNANSAQQKIEAYIYGYVFDSLVGKHGYNYVESQPIDAIEGKIATPLNWRVVSTYYSISQYEDTRLIDVYFQNNQVEADKFISLIPQYWINWENREIMTNWVMDNYNRYLYNDTYWADFTNKNFHSYGSEWMYEVLVHNHEFELFSSYAPWIQSNYLVVNTAFGFYGLANNIAYDSQPIMQSYSAPQMVNILYSYEYAIDSLKTINLNAIFENNVIYDSTNYVRQGGYPTIELAEDAASAYPSDITIIYQQPEGTYSYNVLYTNSVWCGDVPIKPVLKAIAWYLGGG